MKLFTIIPFVASTLAAAASFGELPRLLELAVDSNQPGLAQRALDSGFPVDAPIAEEGVTALMLSAELGKIEMIRFLTGAGASLSNTDTHGYTALHFACGPTGSTEGLRACLEIGGVDLNMKETDQGNTALHFAAGNGSIQSVRALVTAGADINAKNELGNTPIMAACFKDNALVVAYLISNHADYLEVNNRDQDALAIASYTNSINVASMLLRRINPTKLNVNTGIIRAMGHAQTREMKALIQEYFPGTFSLIAKPENI